MSWLRLDDGFPEHEKMHGLKGVGPKWLHVVALCQCAANLTDGFIDPQRLKVICAIAAVPRPAFCVSQLVDAGLWLERDGGHEIKDYLDYNPAAATVKAERAKAKERMQNLRGKRASSPDGSGEHSGEQTGEHSGDVPEKFVDPVPSRPSVNPTEPVGDSSKVHNLDRLRAAVRLYEAIPETDRDEGTERVVLGYARQIAVADFDSIRVSLERKIGNDALFKAAGAYVNGALQKAARKAGKEAA